MKFLVIDDSSTMRRIIINTLKQIGHHDVMEAENGKQALAHLDECGGVDLIITDWNMPVMDGLTFVKNVKSGPYANTPILMVTTMAAKDDVIIALKAGVSNYVIKPMSPETLRAKLDAILAKG